jgi:hypothetical protein
MTFSPGRINGIPGGPPECEADSEHELAHHKSKPRGLERFLW